MKLDWNLIRCILAHVESETLSDFLTDVESVSKWKEGQLLSEREENQQSQSQRVVLRHVQLLVESGYLEGVEIRKSIDGFYSFGLSPHPCLTMSGFSLLESLRCDGYLDKLKRYAKEKSVPLTVDNVIELAKLALSTIVSMK